MTLYTTERGVLLPCVVVRWTEDQVKEAGEKEVRVWVWDISPYFSFTFIFLSPFIQSSVHLFTSTDKVTKILLSVTYTVTTLGLMPFSPFYTVFTLICDCICFFCFLYITIQIQILPDIHNGAHMKLLPG